MNKIYVLVAQEKDYDTRPRNYGVTTNIETAKAWAGINSIADESGEFPARASISERVRAHSHKKFIEALIQRGTVKDEEVTHDCWCEEHIPV